MRYRYPTENSPFLDSGFRWNDGYAEVSAKNWGILNGQSQGGHGLCLVSLCLEPYNT